MSEQNVLRAYEVPAELDVATWWKIEQMWAGNETDTVFVRYESDAARIIGAMLLDQYEARVTWPNGTVQNYGKQSD